MRSAPARLLALLIFTCALGALSSTAQAQQSTLTLRGNYWRDRNTRVLAPEAVLRKHVPSTGTSVEASYLLDAITSASASAGVSADQPFTELRNDISFRVAQRLGPATLSARYRYSTESDYWSHTGGAGVMLELLQKNLTIGVDYVFTSALAARRASPVLYVWANGTREQSGLDTHTGILNISQVLARWAIIEGCYQLMFQDGFQANPYRTVKVSGSPVRETVPLERLRHSASGTLRLTPLHHRGALEYLTIFAKLHVYTDTWKVTSWQPELRLHLALGPVELRGTLRYMTQSAAEFYRSETGPPPVMNNPAGNAEYLAPVNFAHCPPVQTSTGIQEQCATGDSKLSEFQSIYLEGRVLLDLRVFDRPSMPLGHWLGGGTLAVTAGRYLNNNFAKVQYGDAWVGGLELMLPL